MGAFCCLVEEHEAAKGVLRQGALLRVTPTHASGLHILPICPAKQTLQWTPAATA